MLVVVGGMKLAPVEVETILAVVVALGRMVEMLRHQAKQALAAQV
jgi:hypothetical protein